jgi:hypothetical protein
MFWTSFLEKEVCINSVSSYQNLNDETCIPEYKPLHVFRILERCPCISHLPSLCVTICDSFLGVVLSSQL